MKTILFDCETNGLIPEMTVMHCIAAMIIQDGVQGDIILYDKSVGYKKILTELSTADRLVAHNAGGFDIPALKKLFPGWTYTGEVFDTLVLAQGIWNDIINSDYGRQKIGFPKKLMGSHSLEAYGYRLGELKGEYGKKENAWEVYTPAMGEYCKQDVVVLHKLYNRIIEKAPEKMLRLENEFAKYIRMQEERGVYFDEKEAIKLMLDLKEKKEEIEKELQKAFPPVYQPVKFGMTFTARGKSKKMPGLEKGSEYCKIQLQEFNPGSRQQIAERFIKKYGWQPTESSDKGNITVNEAVLACLEYPEAKLLNEYLLLDKRIGMISDGQAAWLKLVTKEGRIHGRVRTAGAVTGRCTHSNPNLAQVPASHSPYGERCRELFTVPRGYRLVGCDASGLELRCLAHYLARYDKGEYANIVLHGDIHTANQQAAGLPTRDMAKTFIYGWLYGAGAVKLGSIVGGGAEEGGRLQSKFMKKFPAIKELKDAVAVVVKEKKSVRGLDGRTMNVRSEHSALNMLLQSAGALVMKRWLIEVMREVLKRGLDACPVLSVHDEAQFEVREDQAEELAKICEESMPKAGEYFKFRIPIQGEAKIGDNWNNTH